MKITITTPVLRNMGLAEIPRNHMFRNDEGAVGVKMNDGNSYWLIWTDGGTALHCIGGGNPFVVDLGEPAFSAEVS